MSPETHEQINNCICATIIQGYGLTETTSSACVQDCKYFYLRASEVKIDLFFISVYDKSFGRVGGPTTICEIKITNWEEGGYRVTDKPYPRGEILVGGDNVSAG